MKNKVQILMSVYRGEKYIEKQLESLLKQKEVNLKILIRIDGFNDPTKKIIEKYCRKYKNVEYFEEENVGYAKSFWKLLQKSSLDCEYFAFCDQDDIWLENKLISAINKIEQEKNMPLLYTSRVISVDNKMKVLSDNCFNTNKTLNIYESLQKNIVPGCVYVFNSQLCNIAKKYNGYMESHDWLLYNIANMVGKILYDENSYIKYRIHENNTIGNKNYFFKLHNKIKRFFRKSKCTRSKMAYDLYITYNQNINNSKIKPLYEMAYYKLNIAHKIKLLFDPQFKGLVFKILVLLNKV